MPPESAVTHAEMERRLSEVIHAVLKEHREANQHQDEAWNLGFRAIRDDFAGQMKHDMSQLHALIEAKLDPIRRVAYGTVMLLVSVLMLFLGYFASHQ